MARVIAPGYPHHITQRGNRRQQTFFCDDDYHAYIDLTAEWCQRYGVAIWAWCLMPNHVHLIAVPSNESGLPEPSAKPTGGTRFASTAASSGVAISGRNGLPPAPWMNTTFWPRPDTLK